MARLYGTEAETLLANGLGANLGGVFEAELDHMRREEWAQTADDALWRRSKLGLKLDAEAKQRVAAFFGRQG
jgi:glycerol-3-phosphate dehydrogenase